MYLFLTKLKKEYHHPYFNLFPLSYVGNLITVIEKIYNLGHNIFRRLGVSQNFPVTCDY